MTSKPTSEKNPGDAAIPTLADVASYAGVSTATVSRSLNSPERVTEETRQRVLAAIDALGYLPNFGARALAARRTNTIGAVIPTMENAIFARGIQAFQEELRELGNTLLIATSQYRADTEESQIRALVAGGADALLLIGYHRRPEIVDFLSQHGIPVLITWAYDPKATLPSIGFDNRRAMMALADQVLAFGHRRIGCISAPTHTNDRARDRVDGIRLSMQRNGLDADDLRLVETPYSIRNGEQAFESLMRDSRPPSVVMCANDVLAVGAIRCARTLGLDVPTDVSITGFDDIELSTIADPPLTTVHVPHREMGQQAARLLIRLLSGQKDETHVQLDTRICLRESLSSIKTGARNQD